jgi:hypothetical protein
MRKFDAFNVKLAKNHLKSIIIIIKLSLTSQQVSYALWQDSKQLAS